MPALQPRRQSPWPGACWCAAASRWLLCCGAAAPGPRHHPPPAIATVTPLQEDTCNYGMGRQWVPSLQPEQAALLLQHIILSCLHADLRATAALAAALCCPATRCRERRRQRQPGTRVALQPLDLSQRLAGMTTDRVSI
jgi:hypothetical protein